MTEEIKTAEAPAEEENSKTADTAEETTDQEEAKGKKKKSFFSENKIEIFVAILLGVTALLTAWATWIGSLHGGNQATNYAKSSVLASEGNSEYNAGLQLYLSDMLAWNTMVDYYFEEELARQEGNQEKYDLLEEKFNAYVQQNASPLLLEGVDWMTENNNDASPFEMPGLKEKYYEGANEKMAESRRLLEEGQKDNAHGDAYNLVNVIYSVVLFMLGIIGIFRRLPNRAAVLIIAVIALVIATVYMCTIPMPTGFDLASFFTPK